MCSACVTFVAVTLFTGDAAGARTVDDVLAMYDQVKPKLVVSVSATTARLANGQVGYLLNALEKTAARKMGAIGMSQPTSANFYYGGFIGVFFGPASVDGKTPVLSVGRDHTGARAADATWTLPQGAIVVRLSLVPGSEALFVEIDASLDPKPRAPGFVRLNLYPQSFNRAKHGTPRANFLVSSAGERLTAPTSKSLGASERWVYLADALYKGKQGGAAVGFAPESLRQAKVHVGSYSVLVDQTFKPGRPVRFFLVDYGAHPIGDAARDVPPLLEAEAKRFRTWCTSTHVKPGG